MSTSAFLGIDTSNYRTSVALVDETGSVLANFRELLTVKQGERGLRQSDAVFQHIHQLPALMEQLPKDMRISAVAVSTRPRPVEGSYMPVFMAGLSVARSLAAVLNVPLYEVSHQEGHIEAVRHGTPLEDATRFVSFHFSGGTTEAILVDETGETPTYQIIGGSKDLSYGQLLDRVGVSYGMSFPSGEEMDLIALNEIQCEETGQEHCKIPKIKCQSGWIHLSGIETHCQRLIQQGVLKEELIPLLFREVTSSIAAITKQLAEAYDVEHFLYAGGVSSSRYLRETLDTGYQSYFGCPALSGDNAVGVALLGGKQYANEAR